MTKQELVKEAVRRYLATVEDNLAYCKDGSEQAPVTQQAEFRRLADDNASKVAALKEWLNESP